MFDYLWHLAIYESLMGNLSQISENSSCDPSTKNVVMNRGIYFNITRIPRQKKNSKTLRTGIKLKYTHTHKATIIKITKLKCTNQPKYNKIKILR